MKFADRTNWNLAPNRLSEALERYRASGKLLIDLTDSNPTECGFTYDSAAILKALANPAALTYDPQPKGLKSARQAVAEYYVARGVPISTENIILTTSTSEAYSFVFRAMCNPGEELLIPEPSYPLFGFLADIQDVKVVRYPLIYDHGWQIDFHSLEQAISPRTRGIVVVHPNNPTGHFTKREEIRRLNALCAKHGLFLVADEVFLDFDLAGEARESFAPNAETLTFTLSGLSKIAGLPQMKVAWLAVSGHEGIKVEALRRLEVVADTFLSMNAPIQHAVPELLQGRESFQKQLMERVRANLAELDRQLAEQDVCARLQIEGGWYAVLRVPATRSDEDLAVELLTTNGVYVHPGHFYDFAGEGFLVVSLIAAITDFRNGTNKIFEFFKR
jgi:aspartate/methionine/tyrosine aminotransferase